MHSVLPPAPLGNGHLLDTPTPGKGQTEPPGRPNPTRATVLYSFAVSPSRSRARGVPERQLRQEQFFPPDMGLYLKGANGACSPVSPEGSSSAGLFSPREPVVAVFDQSARLACFEGASRLRFLGSRLEQFWKSQSASACPSRVSLSGGLRWASGSLSSGPLVQGRGNVFGYSGSGAPRARVPF